MYVPIGGSRVIESSPVIVYGIDLRFMGGGHAFFKQIQPGLVIHQHDASQAVSIGRQLGHFLRPASRIHSSEVVLGVVKA